MHSLRSTARLLALSTVAGAAVLAPTHAQSLAGPPFRITVLALPRGEATIVQIPGGITGLIGSGAKGETGTVVKELKKRGVKRVDTYILSSWSEEHIGGLPEFLKTFPVRRLVQNPMGVTTPVATRAIAAHMQMGQLKGLDVASATMDSVALFFSPPCSVRNVGPIGTMYREFPQDPNCSLVNEFTYNRFTFLNLGDTRAKHQKSLVKNATSPFKGLVVQLSGKGPKDAILPSLLPELGTRYAVLPVPTRSKTKPSPELLKLLEQRKIRVLRTDRNGTITITSDGLKTTVTTER